MRIIYLPNRYSQQRQYEKPVDVYPVRMAMEAEYHRLNGAQVEWIDDPDKAEHVHLDIARGLVRSKVVDHPEGIAFDELPAPDREFTNAMNKKYQRYGNYVYRPATHMQVADGCWHGRCEFCIENKRDFIKRPMDAVIEEIKACDRLGFREIFDDSGTFPSGGWLNEFCVRKISHRLDHIVFGCNMRIGANCDWQLMKRAGFRMILFGIESARQEALDAYHKEVKVEQIIPTIKAAAGAGLDPHITSMFGRPGASEEEDIETLELVHYLLRKGYAKTAQASVVSMPQSLANPRSRGHKYTKRIYDVAASPEFWLHQIRSIKDIDTLRYFFRKIRKGIVRD